MLMQFLHSSNAQKNIVQLQHNLTSWSQHSGSTADEKQKSSDMSVQTESFLAGTSLLARLAAARAQMADAAARRKIYNATVTELGRLTDRDLHDLGIARGNIRAIAKNAAQGA